MAAKKSSVPTTESAPSEKANDRKKFWRINKEMLRFKVHYFLLSGAFGLCFPYITIIAQERIGITASAIAAILTAQRCIFFFAKPAIGYMADFFKRVKSIIFALATITIVFLFVLLVVPKIEKRTLDKFEYNSFQYELLNNSEAYVICELHLSNSSETVQDLYLSYSRKDGHLFQTLNNLSDILCQCHENKMIGTENTSNNTQYTFGLRTKLINMSPPSNSFSCNVCCKLGGKCQKIDYSDQKASTKEISNKIKDTSDFKTHQFWFFAFVSTVSQLCANNVFTLTDAACCERAQKTGAQFGRQYLWGAIGWGLLCPVGGLLNDFTGDLFASWILMAILTFFSFWNMIKLEITNPPFSKNLLKDVGIVLSSKEFLAFMFCVVMNGVGIGIVFFYLVLFLTDIGGSRFLCGMVLFVQNFVGGIPFMFFSGWVIKKVGHYNVLVLSLLAYSIRFFWYSQLRNPWFVLPAEVLNGFTEGLVYTSMASYAKLSAKPGTEATTQAVLSTAHESIGMGFGCIAAGFAFDSIGGHQTFLYVSIYAGCAMVVSIVLHFLVGKQKCNFDVNPSEIA